MRGGDLENGEEGEGETFLIRSERLRLNPPRDLDADLVGDEEPGEADGSSDDPRSLPDRPEP